VVRNVFTHGALYALAGAVSQGMSFLLFPVLAHALAPREFGVVDLLAVLATLVHLTIALEVVQGMARQLPDAIDAADRRAYASTALWFTIAVYSPFALIALALATPLTAAVLGRDIDPGLMRLAVGTAWVTGVMYVGQNTLRFELRPRAFAVVSVVLATVTATTTALLLLAAGGRVEYALVGQLAGAAAGATVALWLARRSYGVCFDAGKLRTMLAFSVPLVPASVGVFLNSYADRLAIQATRSLSDLGVYGVGYRMSLVVGLVLLGFQGSLTPLVLSRYREAGTPAALARVFRLFALLALALFVLVSVFAHEALAVLTAPAYQRAARLIPLLTAAAFLAGMYIFAPGLTIARRTKPMATISAAGGLANVALAFTLVPTVGVEGAAIAFLITSAGSFAALMVLSQRHYPVPHDWRRLAAALSAAAAAAAVSGALPEHGIQPGPVAIKVALAVTALGAIAALLLGPEERARVRALPGALTVAGRAAARGA
jgi:O-antigen/teichoic acid export membrane protein